MASRNVQNNGQEIPFSLKKWKKDQKARDRAIDNEYKSRKSRLGRWIEKVLRENEGFTTNELVDFDENVLAEWVIVKSLKELHDRGRVIESPGTRADKEGNTIEVMIWTVSDTENMDQYEVEAIEKQIKYLSKRKEEIIKFLEHNKK